VVTACKDCTAVYSIKKYDTEAFASVSITSSGVLTYVTSAAFIKQKEREITYKITCPCSNLSTTAKVKVCMKDLCRTAPAGAVCNQCDGKYVLAGSKVIPANESALSKCSGTGTFNLTDLVQENVSTPIVYSLVSATSGLSAVSINPSTGVVTFSKLGEGYTPQEIVYAITTAGYYAQGTLTIQIKNLCATVRCATGYSCNECNGECEVNQIDLNIE
jgi:hypothetical protein